MQLRTHAIGLSNVSQFVALTYRYVAQHRSVGLSLPLAIGYRQPIPVSRRLPALAGASAYTAAGYGAI